MKSSNNKKVIDKERNQIKVTHMSKHVGELNEVSYWYYDRILKWRIFNMFCNVDTSMGLKTSDYNIFLFHLNNKRMKMIKFPRYDTIKVEPPENESPQW